MKSKWGLAFSAVVTIVASLFMSISICAMFGVVSSVNSGEIFPYLVVIIGLENVLVVTRSVVSTPINLEVSGNCFNYSLIYTITNLLRVLALRVCY